MNGTHLNHLSKKKKKSVKYKSFHSQRKQIQQCPETCLWQLPIKSTECFLPSAMAEILSILQGLLISY